MPETATCGLGEGREVAFARLPMLPALGNAGTVRAGQVERSVPGGGRVTTLINVTPIESADGAVGSVVVTLQHLALL